MISQQGLDAGEGYLSGFPENVENPAEEGKILACFRVQSLFFDASIDSRHRLCTLLL
jgi:hypothetical protein